MLVQAVRIEDFGVGGENLTRRSTGFERRFAG